MLKELLRCPKTDNLVYGAEEIKTVDGKYSYQINGKPVLVDFDVSTIEKETLFKSQGKSIIKRSVSNSIARKFKSIVYPINVKIKKILNS